MTYSPDAIAAVYPHVEQRFSSARRSGIAADKAGYHNSRNRLRSVARWRNDYSITEARDKRGDGNAASAIDCTMSTAQLNTVCRRLMAASLARDPRLVGVVREWFGSYTGRSVVGYSLFRRRPATSDPSHEWHFHLSGWRDKATDRQAWLGVAEVICGLPVGALTGKPLDFPAELGGPRPTVSLKALVAAAKADPAREQGGVTPGSEDDVRVVEACLVAAGFLLAQFGSDGAFGSSTVEAWSRWQESLGYEGDDADGIPGQASLEALGRRYGFDVIA